MTQRERMLAIAAGGLMLLVLGLLAWSWVGGMFDRRTTEIRRLTVEIGNQELVLAEQRRATRRLENYERRALPADGELARALYQDWLLDLVGAANLDDAKVNAVSDNDRPGVLRRFTFSINGKGTIQQLTQLLYGFYETDHLHQIRRLQIRPIDDSRDLDIALTIDALSLPGASREDRLSGDRSPRLAGRDIKFYQDRIVGRNLFATPNHPPQLTAISAKTVELGSRLVLDLKARDADPLDTVTFALGAGTPDGATIDGRSGQVRWTPTAVGTFPFEVVARDDGLPARAARHSFQVRVVEPPPKVAITPPPPAPPKLDFDVAKHTFLIGALEIGGRPEVWLQNRTTGKVAKLHQGDKVEFGSVEGVIARIDEGAVVIQIGEKRLKLAIGENLSEAVELPGRTL